MDRQARRDTAEFLEILSGGLTGEIYSDLVGWARYQLEPQASTVIACRACRHIGLIPSIPKVPRLVWTCPGCDSPWVLEPPAAVWIEGSRPVLTLPRPQ